MQNIDELHTTAGTKDLLELHGSLFRVRCIDCDEVGIQKLEKNNARKNLWKHFLGD